MSRHRRILENRLQRRKEVVKGKGLSLDVAPDEELSDGGYSSIEEFQDKETLPHRHRIKRNRFREPYPSLFEYPHQIPTHHTVVNLIDTEQQELQQRIEAKAKQEQEKKSKTKKKGKKETETSELEQSEDIQIPSQTATMPRGNRGQRNGANGDDDVMMIDKMRGIIIGHLEIFPNLREKVNSHSHILWSLKITW